MERFLFDIEADNLLLKATRMWLLVARNLDTKEVHVFKEGDFGWKELLGNASEVVGHNILGYDVPLLRKLFGFEFAKETKFFDTLIVSQVLNYKRFGHKGHSLEEWGNYLQYPKIEFNDFSQYSEEMLEYCKQDVNLNVRVYETLKAELIPLMKTSTAITKYLKAEHAVAKWCSAATLNGWPFDKDAAIALEVKLQEQKQKAYDALSARLGTKTVAVDKVKGVVEPKTPKWTKEGFYNKATADWFGIEPWMGACEPEDRPVSGPYSRIVFEPLSLDSVADVKIFLYRNGWVPTEWNFKVDEDGKKVKSSPKITEDSLEFLGGDGKLYTEFLTAKSRHSILKTWLDNLDENNNLHGECMPIGTPSMRARHSIIVNVPAADSTWGPEMRKLFVCKPGWKLIGCDSAGNQARGLAHYLGNDEFIDILLNGDIHTYNAEKLTAVLKNDLGIDHEVKRAHAKRVLYAFLFGASGAKLWSYIFGTLDVKQGNALKNGFLKAVPGFDKLIDSLNRQFVASKKYGEGSIKSIAGTRIYVDSFHKLLVYLLQATEKITCSAALMTTMQKLQENNIPYVPCIFYHDEIDFMVPEEFAETAAKIGKESFAIGPKLFGINIMDGEGKIGNNWYEVH